MSKDEDSKDKGDPKNPADKTGKNEDAGKKDEKDNLDGKTVPLKNLRDVEGKLGEANSQLKEFKDKEEKAKRDDMKKKGDQDKLIDQLELEKKTAEEKVGKLSETVETIVKQKTESIPEDKRSLIPGNQSPAEQLKYITENEKHLTDVDSKSVGTTTNPSGKTTEDGKKIFTRQEIRDMSTDEFVKNTDEINRQSREELIK